MSGSGRGMKKPTRRNAGKALCAYFTYRDRERTESLGLVEGKGFGIRLNLPA